MYRPGWEPVPSMVSTFGPWPVSAPVNMVGVAASSAGYETSNLGVYVALLVPTVCVVRRLWWANGSTVSASYNVDCGIYSDAGYQPGTRLVSAGSTAQGTATSVQFVDVTDTALVPGIYWIGIAADTNVATIFRTSGSAATDATWRMQQSSAMPLPATATPVESAGTSNSLYLCGFATTASP